MAVSQKSQGSIDGAAQRFAGPVGVEKRVTFTVDAGNAYASGDLIADMTEIANAVDAAGGSALIDQIALYDKNDQTASAYTLIFGASSTSLGSLNSAPNISDANGVGASAGLGVRTVPVASGDWVDMGGFKVATLRLNPPLKVRAAAASTSIYVGVVNGAGTPTFAAGDLVADITIA